MFAVIYKDLLKHCSPAGWPTFPCLGGLSISVFQDEPPQAKNLTSELPASQTIPFLKQRLPSPWHLSLEVLKLFPNVTRVPVSPAGADGGGFPVWGGWRLTHGAGKSPLLESQEL